MGLRSQTRYRNLKENNQHRESPEATVSQSRQLGLGSPLPRPKRRRKRSKADRGLPEDAELARLATAYLRFSCDNSNPTSILDQMTKALDKAKDEERFIPWEYVYSDLSVTRLDASRQGYSSYKQVLQDKNHWIETTSIDDSSGCQFRNSKSVRIIEECLLGYLRNQLLTEPVVEELVLLRTFVAELARVQCPQVGILANSATTCAVVLVTRVNRMIDKLPKYELLAAEILELHQKGASPNPLAAAYGTTWSAISEALEFAKSGQRPTRPSAKTP